MERILHLVSESANDIYELRYPDNLLNFCEYDLTFFAEKAIALCNDALRTGELDFDRSTRLRNTLGDAHVYIDRHLRTVYDRIVIDCWLDYICRRDNIGTGAVWNRFLKCSTPFEKAVFRRLCDFRFNKGINEWLNIVRVQDYAKSKISFVFSKNADSADEAAARRTYFDLIFSVTASELGCRIGDMSATKVFSVGRLPSSPFMFPNISKSIIKTVLSDYDYSEDFSDRESGGELSDNVAMDAFAFMKHALSDEMNSLNITAAANENAAKKLYMPCGLKAAVDLEIDALLESGGWLARCRRCGRYFVRDADHPEEYCSLSLPDGGKTCLEIYELEHPRANAAPSAEKKCREITERMTARINVSMSRSEFDDWKSYLDSLREKVESGELPEAELDSFISYSESLDLSKSKPVSEVAKHVSYDGERVVKPFVPKRIDRSEIEQQKKAAEAPRKPEPTAPAASLSRQQPERTAPLHIIRAGEAPVGESVIPNEVSRHRGKKPQKATQQISPYEPPISAAEEQPAPALNAEVSVSEKPAAQPVQQAEPRPDNEAQTASVIREGEKEAVLYAGAFAAFGEPQTEEPTEQAQQEQAAAQLVTGKPAAQESVPISAKPVAPKIIRKNAAAMSAYGKMSGTPMVTAQPEPVRINAEKAEEAAPEPPVAEENIPEETSAPREEFFADPDPYKDVGSIFDGLLGTQEKPSEDIPEKPAETAEAEEPDEAYEEPADIVRELQKRNREKKKPAKRRSEPRTERPAPRNVPSGIWTEDRGLFSDDEDNGEEDDSELDMLREKKQHVRSNKTQRLYDAIMREPEDNPNVRRK